MNNRPYLSKQINDLTDDWLTPCEYLPYIDALLGDIDLDPCSTHSANVEFLKAKKIYTCFSIIVRVYGEMLNNCCPHSKGSKLTL